MKSPGVRVSTGSLRGRRLEVPPGIRPTEQKVREALFSIWGARLEQANLLDLFAGSAAVAIEAISRGAFAVTVVESSRAVIEVQKRNLALLPAGSCRLMSQPVERALAELRQRRLAFDLIFADPPYAWIPDAAFFAGCSALLLPGGELTLEHSARVELPLEAADLVRTDSRRYGESALTFYVKKEVPAR